MTIGIGMYAPMHDRDLPARYDPGGGISNHDAGLAHS